MKTLISLAILASCAILAAGCGTLDDGRLCQDQDGVLVCEPADDTLGSQEQAAINSGGFGSSLGYICEDKPEGKFCTCLGELDCLRMILEKCIDMEADCPEGGSTLACTCWGKADRTAGGIGTSPYFPGEQDVLAP
jgi:hypothetical protein